MNAHEILDMIGEARGDYLWQAQGCRDGRMEPPGRRLPPKRLLLIAAILAMALLLVGCAVVYVLSLQDMAVGEHRYTASRHEGGQEKTTTMISLQNVNQAALAEWLEFNEHYDTDGALAAANNRNESEIPEPYHLTYSCYTWEMVDALDAIIEKYDLMLLEPYIVVQQGEADILFEALKIGNIHREEGPGRVLYNSGYFYPEGTFSISAEVTLTDSEWSYVNYADVRYSRKERGGRGARSLWGPYWLME